MWPRMGSHYGQDVSGNLVITSNLYNLVLELFNFVNYGVEAGYQGVVMAILSNIFTCEYIHTDMYMTLYM